MIKRTFLIFESSNPSQGSDMKSQVSVYMNKLCFQSVRSMHLFSQLTFNCSKSTIETLENGAKYVQRKQ